MADEFVFLSVIPNDLRFCARDPLQHATLLPVPRTRFSEGNPFVPILDIDHADLDHVFSNGRAVLKVHLVAQHKTVRRIKLKLVVVTEPVKTRPLRNDTSRRESRTRGLLGASRQGTERDGGQKVTAGGIGVHGQSMGYGSGNRFSNGSGDQDHAFLFPMKHVARGQWQVLQHQGA